MIRRDDIIVLPNTPSPTLATHVRSFDTATADAVLRFHEGIAQYEPTPLWHMNALARRLRVRDVWLKDESKRFGLNAFKALGATYGIDHVLSAVGEGAHARTEGATFTSDGATDDSARTFAAATDEAVHTFATATDGNHGRAVAWAAARVGHRAVVFMPQGTVDERLANIRALGAKAAILELSYDDVVREVVAYADRENWIVVQDTAWPGYEEIPVKIMQGYLTMVHEALAQCSAPPSHVFLQCGVGSMAAAVEAYLFDRFGGDAPFMVVVEPLAAACAFRSAAEGALQVIPGPHETIMAGLACGSPSTVAWPILGAHSNAFVACDDEVARRGMRLLARPAGSDPVVVSGESGAITAGLLDRVLAGGDDDVAAALRLNADSRIMLFSTEGDTDRDHYSRVVAG